MENVKKEYKISKRAYIWSIDVMDLCESVADTTLSRIIINQLLRSATSVVANCVEGDSGISKKDFIRCLGISLKECNESKVWIQYLLDRKLCAVEAGQNVLSEAIEISKILASILIKAKS